VTRYLLAGGGTAGHVNPLLAVADRLRQRDADAVIQVLGTAEGLESRLVPARGYPLLLVDRVPFPRRLGRAALRFPSAFAAAVRETRRLLREQDIEVVVGFGGFVSGPAYVAAWRERVPIVVHEANAVPGIANRLGSLFTRRVGVAFRGTRLRGARFVGMPMRAELEGLDRAATRPEALAQFDLDPVHPVLLVTGGSLGARHLNEVIAASADAIVAAGWQLLHVTGERSELAEPGLAHYRMLRYCDRMDLAFSAADLALARAGSATVSELSALGLGAVYVPLAIGNGEQSRNVREVATAGGAIVVADADFTEDWVRTRLVELLRDRAEVSLLAARAATVGVRDGTARTVALIDEATAGGGR
jgi:UDP-N-acetylglucosamine--N-acetylmuramyl-(pentapeptide) pyrophosphoryl-undecaprenol N-acetylglucosamine transferase